MRVQTLALLAAGLVLQVGCVTTPSLTAQAHRRQPDLRVAKKYLAARQLESRGKLEQAREIYMSLLEQQPENPEYQHRLAVVCTGLQRFGEANSLFARARQRTPKNVSLLTDMGYSLYVRGDSKEAERVLRQALALRPDDERAASNLALVIGVQGNLDESLAVLRKVGDESSALVGLAYIHSQRGESDLAEQRYREALERNPNQHDAKIALAQLAKRRTSPSEIFDTAITQATASQQQEELPRLEKNSTAVQQVSASEDSSDTAVSQASFFEESTEPNEPARLVAPAGFRREGRPNDAAISQVEPENSHREDSTEFTPTDDGAHDFDWTDDDKPSSQRLTNDHSTWSTEVDEPETKTTPASRPPASLQQTAPERVGVDDAETASRGNSRLERQ